MQYSIVAMVKAMKIQEVILKAASKEILWIDAADIIGVSYRTMKRWKTRYEKRGYDGLFDRRQRTPSPKRAPFKELETVLTLYREKYMGFNVRHFHEYLTREHKIRRSYTFVKLALQTAGLVSKVRMRTTHRKRRPRKPLKGMMLHLDGSPHAWIPGLEEKYFALLVLMDDATNEIYEMELFEEEDMFGCMKLLKNCVKTHGIFCSLYTDRASQFFYTPKAGGEVKENHYTQIGRALRELGINPIPAYSPEARGRSERMNETLQGRLPNEFRLHGIKTRDEANRFLKEVYIKEHNRRFTVPPPEKGSAFLPLADHLDLDRIFCVKEERTVNYDNTLTYKKLVLQIDKHPLRISFAKCRVFVHEHLDHTLTVTYGPHRIGRFNPEGQPLTIVGQRKRKNACGIPSKKGGSPIPRRPRIVAPAQNEGPNFREVYKNSGFSMKNAEWAEEEVLV